MTIHSRKTKRRADRRGATLLDVAAGSMLLAVMLIPSAHLISQSQSATARLSSRQTMIFEAENLLETTKIALSDAVSFDRAWTTPSETVVTIPVLDGPDLNARTRVAADLTLPAPARLLTIEVDVWHDTDGNDAIDPDEPSERIRTQWASP